MFSPDSPFRNFPSNLDRRQAFYLDGIRHAAEIIEHAFSRLSNGLTTLAQNYSKTNHPNSYAIFYLDAWAFIDALDRLLALWKLQPKAETIPHPWSPSKLLEDLRQIRNIRNVSDHLAQRADQIISSNTAALGELSWVTVISHDPLVMKSCLIRPGFLPPSVELQLNIPKEQIIITNSSGNIQLKAHTYTANLSDAYAQIIDLVRYAESSLKTVFSSSNSGAPIGADLFAICDLDFHDLNNEDSLTRAPSGRAKGARC